MKAWRALAIGCLSGGVVVACGGSNDATTGTPSFQPDGTADSSVPMSDAGAAGSVRYLEGATPGACTAGQQIACPCLGGSSGVQACKSDGTGFEPCQCPSGDSGAGGSPSSPDGSGADSAVAADGGSTVDAQEMPDSSSDQGQTPRDASASDSTVPDTGSTQADAATPSDGAVPERDLHASIAGGSGVIALSPQGNSCGAACASYADGTNVLLFAVPSAGYQFIYWSGDCAGSGTATSVAMTGDRTCVANVAPILTVVVDKGGGSVSDSLGGINGCVNQCVEPVSPGTIVTLSAKPMPGYTFAQWSGDCSGTSPNVDVTMDVAKTCQAVFAPIPYTLTVSVAGSTGGQIFYGAQQSCSATCAQQVYYGFSARLIASAYQGYRFAGWSGDCSGLNPDFAVNITGNASCTATFVSDPDAGAPAGDAGPLPVCNEPAGQCAACTCSTCGGPLAACTSTPGCLELANCASIHGCTTAPSCACLAVIAQYGDVALAYYQKFIGCVNGACGPACTAQDAGAGETSTTTCNALPDTAPVVQAVAVPADLPTNWQGGKIPNGTYYVTQFVHFTGVGGNVGPTGETFQETAVIAGQFGQVVFTNGTVDGGSDPEGRGNFTLSMVSPSQLMISWTCEAQGPLVEDYTVQTSSQGQVTLIVHPVGDAVLFLTKQ